MDYSSFLEMKAELSLVAVMVILLIYDLFAGGKGHALVPAAGLYPGGRPDPL